jgi:hypothetical protein
MILATGNNAVCADVAYFFCGMVKYPLKNDDVGLVAVLLLKLVSYAITKVSNVVVSEISGHELCHDIGYHINYLPVSKHNVVLFKQVHDVLNKYGARLFLLYVIALCVAKTIQVLERDCDSRLACDRC